ncbi:MAG: hypothetical protein CVU62_02795 [Deltaproteobacteria bacterium HGW-Deltaproteobacteria-2]|jgi:hypothetical protein|nr:MAG: hypothetical protein CVU62_02795 [Deltaproteobacteria bacterium HGW-Deltaproteobacteria-2]
MKKLWLVLLSLGLIMAFGVSAFAVDVKVSGEYYAAGMYLNKVGVDEHPGDEQISTAFFFQRLRVGTDFVVSPSLKLVTRFDAMERIWGGARSNPQDYDMWQSAGTYAENENIAFDIVYIDYNSLIGRFQIGYMPDYVWGTVFNNWSTHPTGQIKYSVPVGPFTLIAIYAKEWDNSYSALNSSYTEDTDVDADSYRIGGIYKFNTDKVKGETGILFGYDRDATDKTDGYPDAYLRRGYYIQPYFKVKVGPVDLQGEVGYEFGDYKWEDNSPNTNVNISALSVFLDATANLGMFYAGGSFAYVSGDDPGTADKLEGTYGAGLDWNPCLILFNNDVLGYWLGGVYGHTSTQVSGPMNNAWFFQGRIGMKPTPQWDLMLAVSYATADKKVSGFGIDINEVANGTYGTEIDLVGTYKITNNLSYMLGVGYLFTGDYYKGVDRPVDNIVDDYMLINKLVLSF